MSSPARDTAIVLHQRRYRENSRILDVFGECYGRFSVVARISEKKVRTGAGIYQPFSEALLEWGGRSDLKSLRSAESLMSWTLGARASVCGLYLNELLLNLTHRDLSMPELYRVYRGVLDGLAAGAAEAPLMRCFELALLDELGARPDFLYDCQTGDTLDLDARLWFHPAEGVSSQTMPHGAIQISAGAVTALQHEQFEGPHSLEVRKVMTVCVNRLLNGRTLRSRELIRTLSRK